MKSKKLTDRQLKALRLKEEENRSKNQRRSVDKMSSLSEKQLRRLSQEKLEKYKNGPRQANLGLSHPPEHSVVTREMQINKPAQAYSKKVEKDPRGWDILEEEDDTILDVQLARKSSVSVGKIMKSMRSYGPQEPSYRSRSPERMEQKLRGSSSYWQEHDHDQVDITNYQHSKGQGTDSFYNDKSFRKNSKSPTKKIRENKDLDVTPGSKGLNTERLSVRFKDGNNSLRKYQPLGSVDSMRKQATGGILKTTRDNFHSTQPIEPNTLLYMRQSAPNNFKENERAETFRGSQQARPGPNTHGSMQQFGLNIQERSSVEKISGKSMSPSPHTRGRGGQNLEIFNTDKVNKRRQPDAESLSVVSGRWSRQPSHWAGLTGLAGMGVANGGPGYRRGDLVMNTEAVREALLQHRVEHGLAQPRHKGKYAFRNVLPGIEDVKALEIEMVMQNIVYKHSRQEIEAEQEWRARNDEMIEEEPQQYPHELGYRPKIETMKDLKAQKARERQSRSIDLATLEQRRTERAQKVYEDNPVYQQISGMINFSEEEFQRQLELALDPANSPMPPSHLVKAIQPLEEDKKLKEASRKRDPYSLQLGVADDFLPPRELKKYGDAKVAKHTQKLKILEENKEQKNKTEVKKMPEKHLSLSLDKRKEAQFKKRSSRNILLNGHHQKMSSTSSISATISDNGIIELLKPVKVESLPKAGKITQKNSGSTKKQDTFESYSSNTSKELMPHEIEVLEESYQDDQGSDKYSELIDQVQLDEENIGQNARSKSVINREIQKSAIVQYETKEIDVDYTVRLNNPRKALLTDQEKIIIAMKQKDKMNDAEKVFKVVHEYCKEHLTVSYNMLDKHIEDLLNPKITVSPLLKYFNAIAQHSNFRLPSKAILRFDQEFFRKQIGRYRVGQKMEVQWVKDQVISAARKTMLQGIEQARLAMQKELKQILYDHNLTNVEFKKQLDINVKQREFMEDQQKIVAEMKSFMNSFFSRILNDDKELFNENGGSGAGFSQLHVGPVIENFNAYYETLQLNVEKQAKEVRESLGTAYQTELDRLRNGSSTVFLPPLTSKLLSELNLPPQSQIQKQQASGSQRSIFVGSQETPISPRVKGLAQTQFSSQFGEPYEIEKIVDPEAQFMPGRKETAELIEPLLKEEFSLYGGYMGITSKDKQSILAQEIYKHQRMKIIKLQNQTEILQSQIDASNLMMMDFKEQNDTMGVENDRLKQLMKDHARQLYEQKKSVVNDSEIAMEKVKSECHHDMKQLKDFMSHEVTICTLIKDKMVSENKWQAEKLIKFATMLRIPRYHFDYIEKYGVNEFVDYCEEVVRRERNMQEQKKVNEKRVELRQQYSILKTNRSKLEGMDQHKLNMIDIQFSEPFQIQVSKDGLNRDDHHGYNKTKKITSRDQENKKILKKLEEINWIKNKSVLDLSELIRQHLDKQPQLLAMLQPDIKNSLLYNPQLIKTLDMLEKQDPLNKRVNEIKKFIEQIKDETFGSFNRPNLQSLVPSKISARLRNVLCKSVALDTFSTLQPEASRTFNNSSVFKANESTKNSIFASSNFGQPLGLVRKMQGGDKLNNFIVNMNSGVSHHRSKMMAEGLLGIKLNHQSNAIIETEGNNTGFGTNSTDYQYSSSHIRSKKRDLELEDKVHGLLDDVNTRLIGSTTIRQSNPNLQNQIQVGQMSELGIGLPVIGKPRHRYEVERNHLVTLGPIVSPRSPGQFPILTVNSVSQLSPMSSMVLNLGTTEDKREDSSLLMQVQPSVEIFRKNNSTFIMDKVSTKAPKKKEDDKKRFKRVVTEVNNYPSANQTQADLTMDSRQTMKLVESEQKRKEQLI